MGPEVIGLVLTGFQAAIAAAPKIAEVVSAAKDFFTALFEADLITEAQQDKVHAHIDAIAAAFEEGKTPPAWTVESDPT